jgi:hypothetical protein
MTAAKVPSNQAELLSVNRLPQTYCEKPPDGF